MKSLLLTLAVLQAFQYCAAIPMFDFHPVIEDALRQSIIQLNSDTAGGYLFADISNELLHVTPSGQTDLSVDLRFIARETICPKNSGAEIKNCELNRSPLAEMVTCHSSVGYSLGTFVDVFLRCKNVRGRIADSSSASSSFESSEEVLYQRGPQFQDEYYSSIDWNRQQPDERQRKSSAVGKKKNQRQNLNQGPLTKKLPRHRQRPE
ncbi:secreted phosphoprotein 24-like [Hemitrygon akajei]|uniref:secreted phosphoprotein 24-like n=1 Tax=Hemitrygon akajei TaxID=2704970 RepID=UPI003BF977B8